ncbi:MAG: DNA polymerase I, partial [Rhodospirillaceae bacterium]|nr:DNA polymerase I [Rhodospirillaceae bacterium]
MNKAVASAEAAAAPAAGRPRHVYLIDGSGYVFRAFHALPPMTRSDGTPVGAVFGFTNMLLKLLTETGEVDRIAVVFDAKAKSFRNDIYPDYKANRPEMPPELAPQLELIREAVKAFNLPCVELEGYEADDLIATYARQARTEGDLVTIVSSDKDLMQLVGDRVVMLDPIKNRPIGRAEVMERFGVPPEKVIDVQALAGDSTDNVPGVPGIGVKTAAELIGRYGDLDTLLAHAAEIKQPKRRETLIAHAEQARLSRDLVRLKDDVPVEQTLDSFDKRAPDPQALLAFLNANQFRSIARRVEAKLAESGALAADGTGAFNHAAAARAAAAPAAAEEEPPPEVRYELIESLAELDRWVEQAIAAGRVALAGFG